MTTFAVLAIGAVLLVMSATLAVGIFGLRFSRTTSDFYVASRTVGPGLNASAVSGEYLSAASFLGVAGLVLAHGVDALWYPVGWTAGYVLLLVFVAAPLRRSRAYTLPDFAEFRVESLLARRVASALVVLVGAFYLVPQLLGAGLTLHALTGAPDAVGAIVVALVVMVVVASGGMRSITIAQAFQYWLKLAALLLPLFFLLRVWSSRTGRRTGLQSSDWLEPMQRPYDNYLVYSLILATFLGTMGLPHVVVRFYTNRDGRSARRTTVRVLALLGVFYLLPTVYGVLGRVFAVDLIWSGTADTVVLELPRRMLDGFGADLLSALLGAGAFAAFLSTSSGLVVSIGGVLGQDLLGRWFEGVRAFRIGAVLTTVGALILTVASTGVAVAQAVELAFAVAASTFAPMLLLGIWWRGLTAVGVVAGLAVGGGSSVVAVVLVLLGQAPGGALGAVVTQPALITVPLAFSAMIGVSLATRSRLPAHVGRTMVRLHTPEDLDLARGARP